MFGALPAALVINAVTLTLKLTVQTTPVQQLAPVLATSHVAEFVERSIRIVICFVLCSSLSAGLVYLFYLLHVLSEYSLALLIVTAVFISIGFTSYMLVRNPHTIFANTVFSLLDVIYSLKERSRRKRQNKGFAASSTPSPSIEVPLVDQETGSDMPYEATTDDGEADYEEEEEETTS